ncbi:MAG: hypothetical protein J5881_04740 [Clostridia bacterium]|nr:hypothetical protein [Clostridia bacterium]
MFKNSKFFKIILLATILLYSFAPCIMADDTNDILDDKSTINKQIVETIETSSNDTSLPDINSRSAVVIDRATNTILYGKKENEKCKMASTTKIMTCLVVIENCDLTTIVEVSQKAGGTGGSRLGLKKGDKISVNDLLYGLMLCSRK